MFLVYYLVYSTIFEISIMIYTMISMDNSKLVKQRIIQSGQLCDIINPLNLNNDCWLLICDLLSFQDILNLSKVSQSHRNLVQFLVLPSKLTKWEMSFSHESISLCDFNFILSSIYATIQSLRILFLPDKHFKLLISYQFPNVTKMRLTLSQPMEENDIIILSTVFPNLREFSPHGICSSKVIELFKNLENLSLTCCRNLSKNDFERIVLALNLKSLTLDVFKKISPLSRDVLLKFSKIEVLTLNRIELGWIAFWNDQYPHIFSNLRLLIITGSLIEADEIDKLFENIQLIVPRVVSSIEIANVSDDFLYKYLNPEKYDFLNRVNVLKFINITILNDVFVMPNKYQDLRELYFFYCHAAVNLDVLGMISNSQKLDLISFEECDVPPILISNVYIKATIGIRKKEIILNWHSQQKKPDVQWCNEYRNLILVTKMSHISSNFDSMTIKFK